MNAQTIGAEAVEHAAPDLSIRTAPPSPKRLSRKVLLTGALAAGGVVAFALVSGLSERPERRTAAEQNAVAAAGGPPESIRAAAANYDARSLGGGEEGAGDSLAGDHAPPGVEELAPPENPLWANARAEGGEGAAPRGMAAERVDPDQAARTAPIMFAMNRSAANEDEADARLSSRLIAPGSRYTIQAGQVIPAALVTALNSDLPGRVIAQVTAPVYDSVTGNHLLIPQGARLLGAYDNATSYGDHRLLLVWNRLIFPNGWSINLQGMGGTDPTGAAGLHDNTDNHLDRLVGAIGLSAIISVVANEAEDDNNGSLTQSIGDAAAQEAARAGGRIVDRELAVRPTLRVRAGAPVRVLVTRDIALRPYQVR